LFGSGHILLTVSHMKLQTVVTSLQALRPETKREKAHI